MRYAILMTLAALAGCATTPQYPGSWSAPSGFSAVFAAMGAGAAPPINVPMPPVNYQWGIDASLAQEMLGNPY